MQRGRRTWNALGLAIGACFALATGCGDDDGAQGDDGAHTEDGGVNGEPDPFYPVVEPTDPCSAAGYVFDGESDCDVVRCPELSCECERTPPEGDAPLESVSAERITLSACVPDRGCLSLVDCDRACDPKTQLDRDACEVRIRGAGAQRCDADDDCVLGACREEIVGSICVDTLACAEDGNCGPGRSCLFEPEADTQISSGTPLGTCVDGAGGSHCYSDRDCRYGHCDGQRCSAGLEGSACSLDANCASHFCRITDPMNETGTCVSGVQGGSCFDDRDCASGLHCSGNVCFSDAVGQNCTTDAHCASGICIGSRCRGGELGSVCEADPDCDDGLCVGGRCTTGGVLAPCNEPNDCRGGLTCVRQVCSDGSPGMPCTVDAECAVLACADGACSDGANGAPCNADDECTSQRCADPPGAVTGECTSGAPGAYCVAADDCMTSACALDSSCD